MKKLFTLLVIFTFFVSALSVAQIQKKGEIKKDKQIEKIKQRDPGVKDFDNRKLMFEQNQAINPLFVNPPTMSPNATITLGTQVVASGTSGIGPTNYYWESRRIQFVYTAAEIIAAGGGAGNITALAFDVSQVAGGNLANYVVKMANTTATDASSHNTATLTTVKNSHAFVPGSTGWRTITFDAPFTWDGTSNILVDICWGVNAGYSSTGQVWLYNNVANQMRGITSGSANQCGVNTSTTRLGKPRVQLTMPAGASPNLSVTPSSLSFGYVPYPTTSTTKTYVLSGTNLTAGPIVVTAPSGFEVSLDGSTWASSVNVTYTAPTLANTTIHTHFVPLAAGTPYSGNITNVGGGASTNVAVTGTSLLTYCTSSATSTADDDIGNVTFGTINNGTATPIINNSTSVNMYTDFTGSVAPTDIQRNLTYPISVSGIWSGSAYPCGVSVYVDFNLNGDFTDAGEGFYLGQVNGTTNTITGNIVVPATATLGNVRMRVILVESGGVINPSCGTYQWGETEDYLVNITAPTPTVPSVTTSSVIFASSTTSTTGGNVTFDGLSTVTARGVCWNTTGNPTLSDNYTTDGSGTGTFTSTMTGLTNGQTYYVIAYATNTTGTGYGNQVVYSHFSLTPPFTENFDGVTAPSLPGGWSMQNVNGDGYAWSTVTGLPNSAPNSMYIRYNSSLAMDDWFFTPPVYLETGKTYQVSFQYRGDGTYPERLEVKYGNSPNAAGMTSSAIFSNTNILNSAYALGSGTMNVASNGYYYFGWHGFSLADENILLVDDVNVQEALNNDISVDIMYAKGKVPLNYGANDVITATIRNAGITTQTNINVTLDISNANTFNDVQNIASLAPGASTTVTFSEFIATGTGNNDISVTVPNDENNANNSKTFTQEVTTNTISYSDGSLATSGVGYGTGTGTMLTKYYAAGNALVNNINVFIFNDATNTGKTVFGLVINASGTIIGQSANYVIQAADLGTWITFNITIPPDVSNSDYYVGLAQTTAGHYPVGTQTESPGRPAAYYGTALTGGAFTNYTTLGRYMIEAGLSTPVGMTYVSSTTSQTNGKVYLNSTNQQIMALQVITSGTSSPLSVTDFALNTTGTDNPSTDITNAKIFYTGTTNIFATTTPYGSTVAAPNGVYNISGSQILAEGTNYFWLTYDIPSGATNNNKVDAQCTGITVGTTQTPTVTAPPEFKTIAGTMSGSYAIGSGTFNKVTGKNLHQVEKTRTVKVLIPVEEKVSDSKGSNKGESETKTDTRISYVEKEVEEKYYEMYEGDKPYEGKLFVKMSEVQSMSKGGDPKMSPNVYDEVFADIPTAITELNSRGITGPVTFEFTDATYTTSAVTINAVTGASATNTITFKPQTGENVVISGSTASSLITLNGADYVTFDGSNNGSNSKNLTIRNENTSNSVLTVINGATNNIIKNITFEGASTGSNGVLFFSTGANTNNLITGCDIRDRSDAAGMPAYGIYFGNVTNDGNNVTNCNIYNFTGNGIYLSASLNTLIESCNIYTAAVSAGINVYGIYIGNAGGTNIYKNKIYNLEGTTAATIKGIYYFGSSGASMNVNIINNVIILSPTTSGNIDGIDYFGYTANSLNIYNNSIYIGGSQTSGSSGTYGIRKRDAATTYNQKNNVIVNGRTNAGATSPHYAIYVSSTTATTLDLNYNDYYSNGTGGVLGFWSATNQATISAWRTASSRDAFSISGDPGFTSTSNLQPDVNNANCWNINAGAYPLATVSSDINGNTRNTNLTSGACDIGAYEFTPSAAPIALGISNNFVDGGLSTITFAGIPLATITWHVTGGNTLPSGINAVFQPGVNPSNTLPGSKFANENFEITATDGSGYTYDIVYSYNTARQGTIGLEAMFRLTKYSSGTWTQYSTAPNEVNKTITVTGLNSFSVFTFGDGDAPLPVTLSSFTSILKGRDVTLAWKTESENNNAGFDVERKLTGTNEWKKAGFVAGKGTMNSPVNYTFEDKKLNSGKYNYRLKQIDNNGNYEYHSLSTTIDVSLPTNFNLSQNYPNPFNPTTKIDFDLPFDSKVNIVLYDMTGREVKTLVNETRTAGYHTVQFNANDLSSGTYFYRIMTKSAGKDFVATKKMVLVK